MRRKDKEIIDFEEIRGVIEKCSILHLGLLDQGKPYIVPVNFGVSFENQKIIFYFHGAPEGKKYELMKQESQIVFEAEYYQGVLKRDEALPCKWTASYASVMGEGQVKILETQEEKITAMQVILERHGYQGSTHAYEQAISSIALFALEVDKISCKAGGML